ncbi:hypothetical protein BJ508DRAFT_348703 [Ascobolus immersus RN42]|uniref:Uncharacterized protein n=1 Tax=Ascobolus immersus RN42 TaxID=1160509 RepID=A0A3N4IJE7_ASCIM|nr:hypothetical protein BJ508DRAFT_348703 [Ascobolus immersus RN42]
MAGHGREKVATFIRRVLHRHPRPASPKPTCNVVEIRMARCKYTEEDFKRMKEFTVGLGGMLDPRYALVETEPDMEFEVWDPRYKGRDDMVALFNFPLDEDPSASGHGEFEETVKALQAYPEGVLYVITHVKSES